MSEIHADHFGRQYPSKYSPEEHKYMPATSTLFAFVGGVFASLSSVGAKLAVVSGKETASASVSMAVQQALSGASAGTVAVVSRALLVAFVGACNFLMWLFFTKALRYGDSTARVMMVQTVSNFAATALLGVRLFGDALSLRWWCGASLIAAGLVFLQTEEKAVGYVSEASDGSQETQTDKLDTKKTS